MLPKSAFVLVSSLLLCASLSAQDWIGEASVGIEVRDELGRSIPGAAVVLIRETGSSDSSPPFVFTDEGGQVEVLHLAEGEWQVEVRAAGYMIFNSYLKLSVSAPPVIGFSSRQRTGTFWEPLEVRFFHPGSGDVVLVAGTKSERKEEKKRRAQSRKLAKQDEKAVKRAEQRRHKKPTRGVDVAVLTPPQVAEAEPPPGAILLLLLLLLLLLQLPRPPRLPYRLRHRWQHLLLHQRLWLPSPWHLRLLRLRRRCR